MRSMTDDQRWQAVAANDRRFDGVFFYGVTSTAVLLPPLLPLPSAPAGPGAVLSLRPGGR